MFPRWTFVLFASFFALGRLPAQTLQGDPSAPAKSSLETSQVASLPEGEEELRETFGRLRGEFIEDLYRASKHRRLSAEQAKTSGFHRFVAWFQDKHKEFPLSASLAEAWATASSEEASAAQVAAKWRELFQTSKSRGSSVAPTNDGQHSGSDLYRFAARALGFLRSSFAWAANAWQRDPFRVTLVASAILLAGAAACFRQRLLRGSVGQKRVSVETRAEELLAQVRAGLAPHLAKEMVHELVDKLASDRARLLQAEQIACGQLCQLEERFTRIHSELQKRVREYQLRNSALEKELAEQTHHARSNAR